MIRPRSARRPDGLRPARLSLRDALTLGILGLTRRRMRTLLSALGIAVGVTTLVVVTGIPASGQQALSDELTALGTDTLQAQLQQTQGAPAALLPDADAMVARIGPVTDATAVANTNSSVRRTDVADPSSSAGISVLASRSGLLSAINGSVASGTFLTPATADLPTVVLGAQAARWLGIRTVPRGGPSIQVYIDHVWFTVIGILDPTPLAPGIEQAALVGWGAAERHLGFDGRPTVLYLKAEERAIDDVRAVLPATLSPRTPGLVQVSRPSDVLAAKQKTDAAFDGLFIGLAAVALLVGGIGVANTMIVSVLERRGEIGLRRALGATRGQIRNQFVIEAMALSGLGGAAGAVLGVAATAAYAAARGWPVVLPPLALASALVGALLVGGVAGLYPAMRASRLAPTEAISH